MPTILEILMIDGNPSDIRLLREMCQDNRIHNNVTVCNNIEQTMACLRNEGDYAQTLRPDIIFLNLIMAVKDGLEIWKAILRDEKFKSIPVVLVSVSEGEQDLLQQFNEGNGVEPKAYIYKPIDFDQLLRVVHSIDGFGLALTRIN